MFSVVITTKDRPLYLKRAVESIIDSTVNACEIIIVNDGGLPIKRSDFPNNDINFILINNEKSYGANYSRNIGVNKSSTNYIFFLDDDDAVLTNSFETRLRYMLENGHVGIVYTGVKIVDDYDLTNVKREVIPSQKNVTTEALLKNGNVVGSTSRVLVRKNYFDDVGGFDESLTALQDYDLWIRLSSVSEIISSNDASVLYTIHNKGAQISSNYNKYLISGNYLCEKYKHLLIGSMKRYFVSNIYLRVAISASSSNYLIKSKYAFLSLIKKPSLKSFVFLIFPAKVIKKFYKFV